MALHHGTQPGPGELGLSSMGLSAPEDLALPQFPCVFLLDRQRHWAAQPHGEAWLFPGASLGPDRGSGSE